MFKTVTANVIGGTDGRYFGAHQTHEKEAGLGRLVIIDSRSLQVHKAFTGPNRKEELNAEVKRLIETAEAENKASSSAEVDALLRQAQEVQQAAQG